MKKQIRTLIAEGKTKEALEMLMSVKPNEATLLLARYNRANQQYREGLIDFKEHGLEMARINVAAVEAAPDAPEPEPDNKPLTSRPQSKVFISYNHGDAEVARRVRDYLRQQGVQTILDEDDMPAGMNIMAFIQQSVRACDAMISIVSERSLKSGWVGQESVAAMYAIWLADKKFIPVRLDSVAFDIDFQIAAQEALQQRLQEMDEKIARLRQAGGDTRAFDDDRERLFELKNNLGKIIQQLKSVLALDISGDKFEMGMRKVVESIRSK
ncbi:MAG: TIR domain-containing protein [Saprospiraceae bacterium]|nr:toll/interleukin-1 receptor domain-containing protein [Saprospiraceae bacterium]MDW8229162.1 TIR domain-containing protein [Saprospiraceae bacterium]